MQHTHSSSISQRNLFSTCSIDSPDIKNGVLSQKGLSINQLWCQLRSFHLIIAPCSVFLTAVKIFLTFRNQSCFWWGDTSTLFQNPQQLRGCVDVSAELASGPGWGSVSSWQAVVPWVPAKGSSWDSLCWLHYPPSGLPLGHMPDSFSTHTE